MQHHTSHTVWSPAPSPPRQAPPRRLQRPRCHRPGHRRALAPVVERRWAPRAMPSPARPVRLLAPLLCVAMVAMPRPPPSALARPWRCPQAAWGLPPTPWVGASAGRDRDPASSNWQQPLRAVPLRVRRPSTRQLCCELLVRPPTLGFGSPIQPPHHRHRRHRLPRSCAAFLTTGFAGCLSRLSLLPLPLAALAVLHHVVRTP
jgi:hypothetical protein